MAPSRGASMELEAEFHAFNATLVTHFRHRGKKSKRDKKSEYHPRWLRHKKGVIIEFLELRVTKKDENGEQVQTRRQREEKEREWQEEMEKLCDEAACESWEEMETLERRVWRE